MVRRQLIIWGVTALATCVMLLAILARQQKQDTARWSVFVMGDAHRGMKLFQEKGCARCHSVNGVGGKLGPDLSIRRQPESSLPQLVTAMWNHAPHMWESIRAEKMAYPELSYEDVAHLFSYLYVSRYADEPGDPRRGAELFAVKGCVHCHATHVVGKVTVPEFPPGNFTGAQGAGSMVGDSLGWAQAMWDHGAEMQASMQTKSLAWPRFAGHEMNDLVAFLNNTAASKRNSDLPADPTRGWALFQEKGCIRCHAIQDQEGGIGPSLGPKYPLPDSFAQLAGNMWNRLPDMYSGMKAHAIASPQFAGRDMADVVAFLYSLHYFEPSGSPQVGESIFTWRGCAECHGVHAEGASKGPALRGRGQSYTSIRLATVLWRHGAEMSHEGRNSKLNWPDLQVSDVGHLLSFLNSPPQN